MVAIKELNFITSKTKVILSKLRLVLTQILLF